MPGPATPDFLPLHAAADAAALLEAVAAVLAAAGCDGCRFTVAFRQPDAPQMPVYRSTCDGLEPGLHLTPSRPALVAVGHEGAGACTVQPPGDLRTPDGRRITVRSLRPLRASDNHFGYLLLHDPTPAMAPGMLDQLAAHLALALYKLQVGEERARHQSLDALKVSMMLQTGVVLRELDLERALARLMELTVTTVKGEVGCIALTTRAGGRLEIRAEWGLDEETLSQLRLPDGRPLAELVALEGMLCLFRDRSELADELLPTEALERIHSLVALPVHASDDVRGCVVIANAPDMQGDDVEVLKLVTDVCSTAIDNALHHMHSMERESLLAQLRLAGDIQQGLLPLEAPKIDGASLAGCNLPADESSGDYYDFFRLDAHRVGFVIADATGHGIGAALIATTARSALRALLHQRCADELNLAEVLAQLNELAESDFKDDKFITLFIGLYDAERRVLRYASAGHNPPMLLYRRRSAGLEKLDATGLPLGMFAGMDYEAVEVAGLEAGDLMLVMTDGVNEAGDASGRQFGLERVEALIRRGEDSSPEQLISDIIDELQAFTGARRREDDITMVCLRCEPLGGAAPAQALVT